MMADTSIEVPISRTTSSPISRGLRRTACAATLFLDGIGNLALAAQSKLLTALDRREVTPLGAGRPVRQRSGRAGRSTKKSGSGIGLAMVRQLIHRNGGAVRYARSAGRGARFVVTF
jgi:hypothetical protein